MANKEQNFLQFLNSMILDMEQDVSKNRMIAKSTIGSSRIKAELKVIKTQSEIRLIKRVRHRYRTSFKNKLQE